jgi:hypothetical protein
MPRRICGRRRRERIRCQLLFGRGTIRIERQQIAGWQPSCRQIASRVENRIALALPVLRIEYGSWEMCDRLRPLAFGEAHEAKRLDLACGGLLHHRDWW